jgi:NADPH:quinone reductase-like Zn-dependent oxidoreductase
LLVPLPDGMALPEAAAMCFGGMTARSFLGRAGARAGERILVLGAAGTVGSAMVQLAKHAGLSVTAVTSREKVERVAGLGGDQVIDRRQIDFRSLGQTWDIVADTVAASSFADARAVLREGGRYLAIAGSLGELLALPRGGRRTIGWPGTATRADLVGLAKLAQTGAFRPLIDRVLPFDELPAAHAIVDGGGKSGSIVIRVGAD